MLHILEAVFRSKFWSGRRWQEMKSGLWGVLIVLAFAVSISLWIAAHA